MGSVLNPTIDFGIELNADNVNRCVSRAVEHKQTGLKANWSAPVTNNFGVSFRNQSDKPELYSLVAFDGSTLKQVEQVDCVFNGSEDVAPFMRQQFGRSAGKSTASRLLSSALREIDITICVYFLSSNSFVCDGAQNCPFEGFFLRRNADLGETNPNYAALVGDTPTWGCPNNCKIKLEGGYLSGYCEEGEPWPSGGGGSQPAFPPILRCNDAAAWGEPIICDLISSSGSLSGISWRFTSDVYGDTVAKSGGTSWIGAGVVGGTVLARYTWSDTARTQSTAFRVARRVVGFRWDALNFLINNVGVDSLCFEPLKAANRWKALGLTTGAQCATAGPATIFSHPPTLLDSGSAYYQSIVNDSGPNGGFTYVAASGLTADVRAAFTPWYQPSWPTRYDVNSDSTLQAMPCSGPSMNSFEVGNWCSAVPTKYDTITKWVFVHEFEHGRILKYWSFQDTTLDARRTTEPITARNYLDLRTRVRTEVSRVHIAITGKSAALDSSAQVDSVSPSLSIFKHPFSDSAQFHWLKEVGPLSTHSKRTP